MQQKKLVMQWPHILSIKLCLKTNCFILIQFIVFRIFNPLISFENGRLQVPLFWPRTFDRFSYLKVRAFWNFGPLVSPHESVVSIFQFRRLITCPRFEKWTFILDFRPINIKKFEKKCFFSGTVALIFDQVSN